MKKMKNIFFMLLIAITMVCGSTATAEPEASPDTGAAAVQQTAEPTEKPTAEPTVAPELSDNQSVVKEGATELIFTVSHKDTIEISIVSPKNIVLDTSNPRVTTTSVTEGTQVRVSKPEAGVWTMNASSVTGEAVTVKGSVMYNFDVELQSEKGVIYSGVPNKFIAFVKSKDGTPIDPNILRTATMNLLVKEAGSDKPKEISMTFKGAAFEVTYTHNKVERISVSALATINDAEVNSNSLEIISIVDPNESKGLPIGVIILVVVIITAAGVFAYIKLSDKMKNTKGVKNMSGSLTINISAGGDEKLPVTRNLAMLGMSAGMLSIIGDDEYYDVDGITVTGIDRGVKIINKSRCEVRFSNVGADPNGVNLYDEQYFKIFMPDDKTVITVTYHSGDIFTGAVNNAAAEQQKQMEQSVAEQQEAAVITAEELYKEFDKPEEQPASVPAENAESAEVPVETAIEAPAAEQTEEAVENTVNDVQNADTAEPAASFTIDTSDAVEIAPASDADEDYTPDAAPALESFSFDMSGADTEQGTAEQTADEAQTSDETETITSFTIDTSDAEEIAPAADADEDYTPDVAPALESFSFDMSGADTEQGASDEAADDITEIAADSADKTESEEQSSAMPMFGDLASLANEIAGAAEDTSPADDIQSDNTADMGINFDDLASLAADVSAAEGAGETLSAGSMDSVDSVDETEDLFDLGRLADEIAKE